MSTGEKWDFRGRFDSLAGDLGRLIAELIQ